MRRRDKDIAELNRIIVATIARCRAHASVVFALAFLVATVFSLNTQVPQRTVYVMLGNAYLKPFLNRLDTCLR